LHSLTSCSLVDVTGSTAGDGVTGSGTDQPRTSDGECRPRHQRSWHEGHCQNLEVGDRILNGANLM